MSTTPLATPAAASPRGSSNAASSGIAAMKDRIMTHMNADHALSLRLYLMRYSHVPMGGTTTAEMLDISQDHMILRSGYGRHVVDMVPPMKSLTDARERLVEMHNSCLEELGLSDVVVDRYTPPNRAWQIGLSALCVLIFTTFPFRQSLLDQNTLPGRIWSLGGAAPWLARLSFGLQPLVLTVMVVVHLGEAAWMANTRLKKHWIEVGSWVWWFWVLDCAVEGFGSWTRFDEMVADVEGKKNTNNKKH
ncbi:uncharacterized protein PV06_10299 [Exophiala oligosperma]|uniref:DUF2470 domain-containing protein n=1 Tax=Exophiala oligosperma TaxID=215243 RepID=A0A0D2DP79_9EURO|nr:uncharacterized protein PV06_10299 [Exophiala oligosperma]KIW37659.1 hypothetical protein PV06_10299 [Exophiala oligosperma]